MEHPADSAPWDHVAIGPVNLAMLAGRGREVLRHFAAAGARMPAGNRLERAVGLIERLNRKEVVIRREDPDTARRTLEAMRTVADAFLVDYTRIERKQFRHLFPASELEYFLAGADVPEEDTNAKPRSSQLEMVAAARFILGGAQVRRAEPDLRFEFYGEELGLAVKRITTDRPRTLETALRGATDQLDAYGRRGFAVFGFDPWVTGIALREDVDEFGRTFNERVREAHRLIARTPDKPHVLGVMIVAHNSEWSFDDDPEDPDLEWTEAIQFIRFTEDEAERERFETFVDGLRSRMWNGLRDAAKLLTRPTNDDRKV